MGMAFGGVWAGNEPLHHQAPPLGRLPKLARLRASLCQRPAVNLSPWLPCPQNVEMAPIDRRRSQHVARPVVFRGPVREKPQKKRRERPQRTCWLAACLPKERLAASQPESQAPPLTKWRHYSRASEMVAACRPWNQLERNQWRPCGLSRRAVALRSPSSAQASTGGQPHAQQQPRRLG